MQSGERFLLLFWLTSSLALMAMEKPPLTVTRRLLPVEVQPIHSQLQLPADNREILTAYSRLITQKKSLWASLIADSIASDTPELAQKKLTLLANILLPRVPELDDFTLIDSFIDLFTKFFGKKSFLKRSDSIYILLDALDKQQKMVKFYLQHKAEKYYHAGKYAKARTCFEKLARHHGRLEVKNHALKRIEELQKIDASIALFKKALDKDIEGKFQEADKILVSLATQDTPDLIKGTVRLFLGEMAYKNGNLLEAKEHYLLAACYGALPMKFYAKARLIDICYNVERSQEKAWEMLIAFEEIKLSKKQRIWELIDSRGNLAALFLVPNDISMSTWLLSARLYYEKAQTLPHILTRSSHTPWTGRKEEYKQKAITYLKRLIKMSYKRSTLTANELAILGEAEQLLKHIAESD